MSTEKSKPFSPWAAKKETMMEEYIEKYKQHILDDLDLGGDLDDAHKDIIVNKLAQRNFRNDSTIGDHYYWFEKQYIKTIPDTKLARKLYKGKIYRIDWDKLQIFKDEFYE